MKSFMLAILINIAHLSIVVGQSPAQDAKEPRNLVISRTDYAEQLEGFWLGQCIANWTGLVTEMDKIGDTPKYKTGAFYTRDDWGQPDLPNIWSSKPSDLSPTIDFVFRGPEEVWGADDDTDIEYMYQHLLLVHQTCVLSAEQIRAGWLKHIRSKEENYLWVSNERAYRLMEQGVLPPETSDPAKNPEFEMIDAQLTTEIFGLLAPGRLDIALKMAELPIRTTARGNAAWTSDFYVTMHGLAVTCDERKPLGEELRRIAATASKRLPDDSYAAKIYDYVESLYRSGIRWEAARDAIHQRYQVEHADGYDMSHKLGNGCFAAGINFAASLISLFYGDGDLSETIRIGALAGWDSDNPTATWGGLLGFIMGKAEIEKHFDRKFSDRYHIHRTRRNFPDATDTFPSMAKKGIQIIDRLVREEFNGTVDLKNDRWRIPITAQVE